MGASSTVLHWDTDEADSDLQDFLDHVEPHTSLIQKPAKSSTLEANLEMSESSQDSAITSSHYSSSGQPGWDQGRGPGLTSPWQTDKPCSPTHGEREERMDQGQALHSQIGKFKMETTLPSRSWCQYRTCSWCPIFSLSPPSSPASFETTLKVKSPSREESTAKQAVLTLIHDLMLLVNLQNAATLDHCLLALEATHQEISGLLN